MFLLWLRLEITFGVFPTVRVLGFEAKGLWSTESFLWHGDLLWPNYATKIAPPTGLEAVPLVKEVPRAGKYIPFMEVSASELLNSRRASSRAFMMAILWISSPRLEQRSRHCCASACRFSYIIMSLLSQERRVLDKMIVSPDQLEVLGINIEVYYRSEFCPRTITKNLSPFLAHSSQPS